jgi:hypothetical protein
LNYTRGYGYDWLERAVLDKDEVLRDDQPVVVCAIAD